MRKPPGVTGRFRISLAIRCQANGSTRHSVSHLAARALNPAIASDPYYS